MMRLKITCVLLITLLLGACSSLPRSGPVFLAAPAERSSSEVVQSAFGPSVGSTPEQLVRDFLRACAAGYSDDWSVARTYLDGAVSESWQPAKQVRIFSSDVAPELVVDLSKESVEFSANATGSINEMGYYEYDSGNSKISSGFILGKNAEGEWRIVQLEDGVLLSQSAFVSAFSRVSLFFLTSDRTELLPDIRWYPQRRLASFLVQGLLAGPNQSLEGIAQSAFPTSVSLPTRSVELEGSVARVDLRGTSEELTPEIKSQMKWQLQETLSQVPSISEVVLTINANTITAEPPSQPVYQLGKMVMLSGDDIVVSSRGGAPEVITGPALKGTTPSYPRTGPAINSPVVFLDRKTNLMLLDETQSASEVIFSGQDLIPPIVDRFGWIWTAKGGPEGEVVAVNAKGIIQPISQAWHDSGSTIRLDLSLDGSRALIVRNSGDSMAVFLVGVSRNDAGVPEKFTNPLLLGSPKDKVLSATWLGSDEIAVLFQAEGENAPKLSRMQLGSFPQRISVPPGSVEIAGSALGGTLVIGTDTGEIFERTGAAWQPTLEGIRQPSFSG